MRSTKAAMPASCPMDTQRSPQTQGCTCILTQGPSLFLLSFIDLRFDWPRLVLPIPQCVAPFQPTIRVATRLAGFPTLLEHPPRPLP